MIRAITTATVLLTLSGVAVGAKTGPDGQTVREHCAEFSKDAEAMMEDRQEGERMRDMMADAENRLTEYYISKAYDEPQWPEGHREKAIRDFGDEAYQHCYRILAE